eukprot:COSAG06_NODE_864_length_11873_cov_16.077374_7_plen_75_part_00
MHPPAMAGVKESVVAWPSACSVRIAAKSTSARIIEGGRRGGGGGADEWSSGGTFSKAGAMMQPAAGSGAAPARG